MKYWFPILSSLAAASLVSGCASTATPMTFGDVPRDGRGLPVWSEVLKKAKAGGPSSGAGRVAPVGSR
jgi:hypothetical protein